MYDNVINLPEDAQQRDLVWLGDYLMPHDHRFTVFFFDRNATILFQNRMGCASAEPRSITFLKLIAQHLHWSWIGPVIEAGRGCFDNELMWRETHYSLDYEADFLHHRRVHRILEGGWVDLPQQPIRPSSSEEDDLPYAGRLDYGYPAEEQPC